jgi:ADP-heptose:LPS heptosyltransferase
MPTVVILRALGLGDLVAATPALRAIARAFPLHRRVLCAPEFLRPIVPLIGGIDELIDTQELAPIDAALARPQIAVNLHGRGPRSTALLQTLRPERLITFTQPGEAGPQWNDEVHERRRWCELLEACDVPAPDDDMRLRTTRLEPVYAFEGATVVHPGAASPARRWPADRFAAVARAEHERGRRVVVTGTRSERDLCAEVVAAAGLPRHANLAGWTTLGQLAAIIARAGAVCSGDTGPAHLASGFGTPSVVLFGPTPPYLWGPPVGDPRHHVIWKGQRADPHDRVTDAGLLEIAVPEVVEALESLPTAA